MTANECSVAWCTVDHASIRDTDKDGSRFHWSDELRWSSGPINDPEDSKTWSTSNEVAWVEFAQYDTPKATPPRGAIRLVVNNEAALTEAQVRELAAWFIARADDLHYLNNSEEVASCPST